MITITVYQRKEKYIGFLSKGHANYAKEGHDIICAAVSALTINTVNSIETFTEDDFSVKQDDGYLKFELREPVSAQAHLLMQSLILGLSSMEGTYGKAYMELRFKEV